MPSTRLVFKGEKLPKQDLDDVFVEFYRLESIMANTKENYQTKYIIIRLVTIIEQFFRNIVQIQLEDNPSKLPKEITLNTLAIDDIIDIISKKIRTVTKEYIISLSYSFQNTGAINDALNNYRIGFKLSEDSQQNYLKKENYDRLFKLRHEVVHTINSPPHLRLEIKQYYDLIEELMKHVLDKIEKRHLLFYYLKGKSMREIGDATRARECYEKAVDHYDKTLALKPNDVEAHYGKGIALLELSNYNGAMSHFDSTLALRPDDVEAHYGKGLALSKLGKYDETIECYDKAIALKPNDADLYSSKGISLFQLNKYYEAIECFDKAIALKPGDADLYLCKVIPLFQLNKYYEAIECFDKAIALKPNDATLHSGKGIMLFNVGEYGAAEECCDKAIELKPDYVDAYYGKSEILHELGNYDLSEKYKNKAEELRRLEDIRDRSDKK